MTKQPRPSPVLARRALLAAGVGGILGAADLLVPTRVDEVQARKGKNKGKNKGKSEGTKHKKKQENRVRSKSFQGVNITFINGTSSDAVSISRDGTQTERQVRPGESLTLAVAGLAQHPVGIITAGNQSYVLYAQNPMIGQPWVKILDRTSDGLVLNENLDEGEQIATDLFRVQRTDDSAEYKQFVLTLLRAPSSSAAASTDASGSSAQTGKNGKGKKGKKGEKGKKGKNGKKGNDGKGAGGEVREQWVDGVIITITNRTPGDAAVFDPPETPMTTLKPGESHRFLTVDQSLNFKLYIKNPPGQDVQFQVSGENPDIGLPYIKIWNETVNTKVFDESFEEGDYYDTGLFHAKRLTDNGDFKEFQLEVFGYTN